MGRIRRDMRVCRVCSKKADKVPFVTLRGIPQGICKQCRAAERRGRYYLNKANAPNSYNALGLQRHNLSILHNLNTGWYLLLNRHSKKESGAIFVGDDSIFMNIRGEQFNFINDYSAISWFMANKGVSVSSQQKEGPLFDLSEQPEATDIRESLLLDQESVRKILRIEIERLKTLVGL